MGATYAGFYGLYHWSRLTVTYQMGGIIITEVMVSPASAVVEPGQALQFSAAAKDDQGQTIPGVQFTWSVEPPEMGSVSASGLFSAESQVGSAKVVAAVGTVKGEANVAVGQPDFVLVGPEPLFLQAGEEGVVQAFGYKLKNPRDSKADDTLDPFNPNDKTFLEQNYIALGPVPAQFELTGDSVFSQTFTLTRNNSDHSRATIKSLDIKDDNGDPIVGFDGDGITGTLVDDQDQPVRDQKGALIQDTTAKGKYTFETRRVTIKETKGGKDTAKGLSRHNNEKWYSQQIPVDLQISLKGIGSLTKYGQIQSDDWDFFVDTASYKKFSSTKVLSDIIVSPPVVGINKWKVTIIRKFAKKTLNFPGTFETFGFRVFNPQDPDPENQNNPSPSFTVQSENKSPTDITFWSPPQMTATIEIAAPLYNTNYNPPRIVGSGDEEFIIKISCVVIYDPDIKTRADFAVLQQELRTILGGTGIAGTGNERYGIGMVTNISGTMRRKLFTKKSFQEKTSLTPKNPGVNYLYSDYQGYTFAGPVRKPEFHRLLVGSPYDYYEITSQILLRDWFDFDYWDFSKKIYMTYYFYVIDTEKVRAISSQTRKVSDLQKKLQDAMEPLLFNPVWMNYQYEYSNPGLSIPNFWDNVFFNPSQGDTRKTEWQYSHSSALPLPAVDQRKSWEKLRWK